MRSGRQSAFFFWGGVLGLAFFCLGPLQKKKDEVRMLEGRLMEMEGEIASLEERQSDLLLALQSQADPAWVELVLMRELGVVPENWLKVHFQK